MSPSLYAVHLNANFFPHTNPPRNPFFVAYLPSLCFPVPWLYYALSLISLVCIPLPSFYHQDAHINDLASGLGVSSSLTELYLSNNCLSDEGFALLFKGNTPA